MALDIGDNSQPLASNTDNITLVAMLNGVQMIRLPLERTNLTMIEVAANTVPTPAVGNQILFIDSFDNKLKRKDSTGGITIIG